MYKYERLGQLYQSIKAFDMIQNCLSTFLWEDTTKVFIFLYALMEIS